MPINSPHFHFKLKHPRVEEAYWYGYECSKADIEESHNPFSDLSREGHYWTEGWWDAFYDQDPIFPSPMRADVVNTEVSDPANDQFYHQPMENLLTKFLEISGVLVISAILGYQLIELVA